MLATNFGNPCTNSQHSWVYGQQGNQGLLGVQEREGLLDN